MSRAVRRTTRPRPPLIILIATCVTGLLLSACIGSTNRIEPDGASDDDEGDVYTGPPPDVGPLPDVVQTDAFTGDTEFVPAPGLWSHSSRPDAGGWQTVQARGEPARNAPTERIRAGFDIEQTGFAFFLTNSSVYRLNLHPPQWQPAKDLEALFPTLVGVQIAAAYSNERDSPNDEIVILGKADGEWKLWRGSYNFMDGSFEGFASSEASSPNWSADAAPSPDAIKAAWRDNDNLRGWLDRVPSCDEANDAFDGYISWMSPSSLHVRDAFFCPEKFFSNAVGRLLENKNRPPSGAIGAAFQHRHEIFWIEQ